VVFGSAAVNVVKVVYLFFYDTCFLTTFKSVEICRILFESLMVSKYDEICRILVSG
jgi:hypothetical protein